MRPNPRLEGAGFLSCRKNQSAYAKLAENKFFFYNFCHQQKGVSQ